MYDLKDNVSNWEKITCYKCGISFYVPKIWEEKRRDDHASFSCPNKHSQYFPQESDVEKLKKRVKAAQCAADEMEQCCINSERRRVAQKAATTRLKNKYEVQING